MHASLVTGFLHEGVLIKRFSFGFLIYPSFCYDM
jgi:hypothetical protein